MYTYIRIFYDEIVFWVSAKKVELYTQALLHFVGLGNVFCYIDPI